MLIPCVSSCCFPFSFSDSQDAVGLCAAIWEVHRFLLLMLRLKGRFNLAFFLVVFLFYLFFFSCQMELWRGKLCVDRN